MNKGDSSVHSWITNKKDGRVVLRKLNGLFSGLLIDNRNGEAFLFNDRYGVERIYVHESKGEDVLRQRGESPFWRFLPELRELQRRRRGAIPRLRLHDG